MPVIFTGQRYKKLKAGHNRKSLRYIGGCGGIGICWRKIHGGVNAYLRAALTKKESDEALYLATNP